MVEDIIAKQEEAAARLKPVYERIERAKRDLWPIWMQKSLEVEADARDDFGIYIARPQAAPRVIVQAPKDSATWQEIGELNTLLRDLKAELGRTNQKLEAANEAIRKLRTTRSDSPPDHQAIQDRSQP